MISVACSTEKKKEYNRVAQQEILQNDYSKKLQQSILYLQKMDTAQTIKQKKEYYKKSRFCFKSVEPYLSFFDKNNYKSLNAPNILKIEEEDATNIKINNPFGFQVIEELLFDDNHDEKELKRITNKTLNRLQLVANTNKILVKDYHLIWLLRNQIATTALTGLSGFDSPVLEQSIAETKEVYKTIEFIIQSYKNHFSDETLYNDWINELNSTFRSLQGGFKDFDRYSFIKKHSHKQLELLQKMAKDWNVTYPFALAFSNEMNSLFSPTTFNVNYFSTKNAVDSSFLKKAELGKQLFNDTRLSKNNSMSCASCHQKEKAFTDGLRVFENQKRNTPTLTYSAFQKAFFYDSRSGSLEGQIISVVNNKDEFHSNLNDLENFVSKDSVYTKQFKKIYGTISNTNIRNAIADYIRTLNKFNSKFDANINGKENSLTASEKKGFNIFMGKGKCATCHFPPVFNGTVPPNYNDTELEAIGVPNLAKTDLSEDLGRYNLFKTEERKHFFKTPTIRNIEKTAPYMHNGTYQTLEEVMDFYNKGGGVGLGFVLEHQTLPFDNLELSEQEISEVIAFMKTLTDR